LIVDEEVQRMIHTDVSEHEIEKYAIKNLGMHSLRMDAIRYILSGDTSIEEVVAVTKE
jgi:general secretion pathway protein E